MRYTITHHTFRTDHETFDRWCVLEFGREIAVCSKEADARRIAEALQASEDIRRAMLLPKSDAKITFEYWGSGPKETP